MCRPILGIQQRLFRWVMNRTTHTPSIDRLILPAALKVTFQNDRKSMFLLAQNVTLLLDIPLMKY